MEPPLYNDRENRLLYFILTYGFFPVFPQKNKRLEALSMSTILIGIAGGTGSGKATLTRHLKEHFGPEVSVISHDSYYKRQDGKTLEERAKVNYDHPAAFDTDLLIEHLKELKAGRPIQCPVYSYVEHNRTAKTREILPTKVIIVEGILIF